jgi:molybdopterin synthase sulfur carrier subunit
MQYFASMREDRGCDEEVIETSLQTLGELYDQLRQQYGFSLERKKVRVAVNDTFVSWDVAPREGDLVVFIPPVGGG